jgi:hypothetical protein
MHSLNSILDLPFIGATRRNHALEHATLHVLSQKYPNRMLGGHSNPSGFFILGDVPLEAVADASTEALHRLRAGERQLAIHPGCGTNLATSALFGATLGWFAMRGARSTTERMLRLPFALTLAVLGMTLSRPLGPVLQQRITTDADLGPLRVTDVRHILRGRVSAHRVVTMDSTQGPPGSPRELP